MIKTIKARFMSIGMLHDIRAKVLIGRELWNKFLRDLYYLMQLRRLSVQIRSNTLYISMVVSLFFLKVSLSNFCFQNILQFSQLTRFDYVVLSVETQHRKLSRLNSENNLCFRVKIKPVTIVTNEHCSTTRWYHVF